VTRLDLADLVTIAGRALGIDPDDVLAFADLDAAGEVLAEAERCQVLQWSAAILLHGLATRRPFGRRSTEVALLAALQFLALNRYQIDDLGPPEAVRKLLDRAAAGEADVDELTAWVYGLLPGPRWPVGALQQVRRLRPTRHKEGGGKMFERFTDRARRVVVLAQEEARLLNHNYLGTEHLLLGLIQERDLSGSGPGPGRGDHRPGPERPDRAHPVHSPGQEGPGACGARSQAAGPQLHRHRAHPARPGPGG